MRKKTPDWFRLPLISWCDSAAMKCSLLFFSQRHRCKTGFGQTSHSAPLLRNQRSPLLESRGMKQENPGI